MLELIYVSIFMCAFNGTIVFVSKKKFGRCMPVSMMLMTVILYYSQFLFHTFDVGYYVIWIISGLFVLCILHELKYKSKEFKKNYFTEGFCCFWIIVSIFIVIDWHEVINDWDELAHWGVMTKELLRLDDWYSVETSRLMIHRDYPPFVSLFEMLWCRLRGGYDEVMLYHAIHIFMLTLLTPPIIDGEEDCFFKTNSRIKKFFNIFLTNLIVIIIIKIFDYYSNVFETIYKDIILSAMCVYGISLISNKKALNEKFDFGGLVLCCTALLLTKQMGICFVLIIWFYYALCLWRNRKELWIRKKYKIFQMTALIIIPFINLSIWKGYIRKLGLSGQFDLGQVQIKEFLAVLKSNGENLKRLTFDSFISALYERDIIGIPGTITYVTGSIIICILLWIIWKNSKNVWKMQEALDLAIILVCCSIGYALTMCILYLFCFSEYEMSGLASYERYMPCCILAEALIVFTVAFRLQRNEELSKLRSVIAVIITFLVLWVGGGLRIFILGGPGEIQVYYHNIANELEAHIDGNEDVFVLSCNTAQTQFYVNYYCEDIRIALCYTNMFNENLRDRDTKAHIMETVFAYNYLYVIDMNSEFNEAFSWVNSDKPFEAGHLYHILHETERVSAELVY